MPADDLKSMVWRPVMFIAFAVKKLLWFSVGEMLLVIAYLITRKYLPQEWIGRGDYGLAVFSFVSFVLFLRKMVKAWIKSGKKEMPQTVDDLVRNASAMIFVLLAGAVNFVVLYVVALKFMYNSLDHRGLFGDSFGVLNSLVSTGALIGLWITVWLQHRQNAEDRARAQKKDEEARMMWKEEMDAKRRLAWPVVVCERIEGTLQLQRIDAACNVFFKAMIKIRQRNHSELILLNQLLNVKFGKLSDNKIMIDINAQVVPFVKKNEVTDSDVTISEAAPEGKDVLEALAARQDRMLRINTIFGTAQKFYYSITQEFVVGMENSDAAQKIIRMWKESLAVACVDGGDKSLDRMAILTRELQLRGGSLQDTIALEFRDRALQFNLNEIDENEFRRAIENGKQYIFK